MARLTTFLSKMDDRDDRFTEITDQRLSMFFFAGLAGRFDVGGYTAMPRRTTYARR